MRAAAIHFGRKPHPEDQRLCLRLLHDAAVRGDALCAALLAERLARGEGVSPAVQTRLAEPFVSGTPNGGSGLGLAICRSICDALHAQLHLRNRHGNGAVEGFDAVVEFLS